MAFYTLPYTSGGDCCPTCPVVQSCTCDETDCAICSTYTPCSTATTQPDCSVSVLGYTVPFFGSTTFPSTNTWKWLLQIDDNCFIEVDLNCNPNDAFLYEVIVSIVGVSGSCPVGGRTTWLKGFSEGDNIICCVGGVITGTATGLSLVTADCYPDIPCSTATLPFDVDVTFG